MPTYRARTEFCRTLCDLLPSHDFCALCDRVIRTDGLIAHLQGIHGELLRFPSSKLLQKLPAIQCELCSRVHSCYAALERHMLMDHDVAMREVYFSFFSGTKRMTCGYCGENERNIIDHLLEVHGKQIVVSFKPIECSRCQKQFELSVHYEHHIQDHCCIPEGSEEEI
ncbi:hypothetical protein RB195_005516 [Necator americanus]|uniref:C2H2-type domain-containing protein n=1 Tax=Necator americanus TaxID=51031 RepID=A0ABR1BN86_NECAM